MTVKLCVFKLGPVSWHSYYWKLDNGDPVERQAGRHARVPVLTVLMLMDPGSGIPDRFGLEVANLAVVSQQPAHQTSIQYKARIRTKLEWDSGHDRKCRFY